MCVLPVRNIVGFSGDDDSGPGSGAKSASVTCGGRTGKSSVPLKISKVARSGLGQIIGQ
jgi:hypothetical protein